MSFHNFDFADLKILDIVSYLNSLINMPFFICFMKNYTIIRDFVHNNSTYIIEEKSLF